MNGSVTMMIALLLVLVSCSAVQAAIIKREETAAVAKRDSILALAKRILATGRPPKYAAEDKRNIMVATDEEDAEQYIETVTSDPRPGQGRGRGNGNGNSKRGRNYGYGYRFHYPY